MAIRMMNLKFLEFSHLKHSGTVRKKDRKWATRLILSDWVACDFPYTFSFKPSSSSSLLQLWTTKRSLTIQILISKFEHEKKQRVPSARAQKKIQTKTD